jgi:hypothetical protein
MRGKIVVTVVIVLAGILLVVYTNAATGGWADTATPTPTHSRFVTNTPAKTPTKTALAPTVVRTATPLIFPTFAFTPRPVTILIGTPVPPLTAHTWKANPVILLMISYGAGGGDGGDPLSIYGAQPSLIVYSDGQVFTYNEQGLVTVRLSPTELCALLNTIDQYGFFDYDSRTYLTEKQLEEQLDKHLIMMPSGIRIDVNAWRTTEGSFYALREYTKLMLQDFQSCPECKANAPTILPALWNTYWFLRRYNPPGLQVYQPEREAIWAVEQRESQPEDHIWPLKSPTLKQVYQQSLLGTAPDYYLGDSTVLSGDSAKTISAIANESVAKGEYDLWFTDGKDSYRVLERTLLPYQEPAPGQFSIDPSISIRPTTLSCQPSDGVLAMPQP